jgi:hypothetical protein
VADHNPEFGVFLFEANAGMTLRNLSSNGHSTPSGCHGAGLLVEQSSVVAVTGTVFSANCVGICNSGSTRRHRSDMFDSNATDLDVRELQLHSGVSDGDPVPLRSGDRDVLEGEARETSEDPAVAIGHRHVLHDQRRGDRRAVMVPYTAQSPP